MNEAVVHVFPAGRLAALVGNPNAGKTALFNRLTGSRQKVANYAGVTIERKEGRLDLPSGKRVRVLDLPGTYSLYPRSPDEKITCDVLGGRATGEKRPDLVVCVLDATQLRRGLRLVLGVLRTGLPCVVAVNMMDRAEAQGVRIDLDALGHELGVPVVSTVAIHGRGIAQLQQLLDRHDVWHAAPAALPDGQRPDHEVVGDILGRVASHTAARHEASDRIDRVVLHPVGGPLLLAVLLFLVFQAVFSWATLPMELIREATAAAGNIATRLIPPGLARSFVVDAVIAGAGGVVVFLPQILILFFFILVLEESGYLPRAAFLLDRIMGSVGLSGRSFIPLLSSFACAVPGIMATRTIPNARDRLATIMLAPLMTCSARLPVYALLIGAFVPARHVAFGLQLQGLVLFALYLAGVVSSMAVAWTMQRLGRTHQSRPLMMELPWYNVPRIRDVAIGLLQRAKIFLRRVGMVILVLTVVLWLLASFPAPPEGATGPAIQYSFAGMVGRALAVVLAPIGFNWQIGISLVPGMAAREVMVGALGTVYALSATGTDTATSLTPLLAGTWSTATGYSLLAWFVFAPQCFSTLAAVRRETGQWRWPVIMATYLFALAYAASWVTYRIAS
jgi:ferrous iron transport protein B